MKIELIQTEAERMLDSSNVIVKLDGREVQCVQSINVEFDARNHIPLVTMTIIPTELKVDLDGEPVRPLGKVVQGLAEGHIHCSKNDEPQIIPDDTGPNGMFPENKEE